MPALCSPFAHSTSTCRYTSPCGHRPSIAGAACGSQITVGRELLRSKWFQDDWKSHALRRFEGLFRVCNQDRFRDGDTQRCRETRRLTLVKGTEQVAVIWQNQASSGRDHEVTMGGQKEGGELGHGKDQRAGHLADESGNCLEECVYRSLRGWIPKGG